MNTQAAAVPETLPLDCIELDNSLQPRCTGIDEAHVAALMETPETWPPITAAMRGQAAVLVDGFHRYEAAVRLGLDYVSVRVVNAPTDDDYFRLAFELNAAHGRPLTLTDRKAYAYQLLKAHPDFSDREIGRRTGLNHETVGALRERGNSIDYAAPERKPGEIEADVGLFDPIRFARATKEQKAIGGYVKRLVGSLEDPYPDADGYSNVPGWSEDATAIAQACFATMGAQQALDTLKLLEQDARFLLDIAKARKQIAQSYKENP